MKNGIKTYGVLAALAAALVVTPSLAEAASSYNVDISISFGPTASVVMKHAHHKGHPVPWVYADPRNRPPGPPPGDPRFDPKKHQHKPQPQPQPVPPPKMDPKKKVEPPKAPKPEPQKPQVKQPEPKKTQPKQPQAKPQPPRR